MVPEDERNAVTEHHEGKAALCGRPVLDKDQWAVLGWCSGITLPQRLAPFLPLQM